MKIFDRLTSRDPRLLTQRDQQLISDATNSGTIKNQENVRATQLEQILDSHFENLTPKQKQEILDRRTQHKFETSISSIEDKNNTTTSRNQRRARNLQPYFNLTKKKPNS